jgi:hypothetical protein
MMKPECSIRHFRPWFPLAEMTDPGYNMPRGSPS